MHLDNTVGTGDFFDYNQHFNISNNYSPSTLVSVLVFSDEIKIEQLNLEIIMEIYYRTHQYLYQMAQMAVIYLNFILPVQMIYN